MARRKSRISGELLDELLGGEDPREAFRSGELFAELQKSLAERALRAEMEVHLSSAEEVGSGNHRNGHNRKRVLTGTGSVDLAVPRDREGRFEPQLIEKWARRLPGFDEKVISLYARGMTTREIRAHVEELYGVTVSRELISKVTDEIHEELREWRSRPLEAVYPLVYFDALRVKIREEGVVQNAEEALDGFEASSWGRKFPAIVRRWNGSGSGRRRSGRRRVPSSRSCSAAGSRWRLCEPAACRAPHSGGRSASKPPADCRRRRLEPVESAVLGKSRRP